MNFTHIETTKHLRRCRRGFTLIELLIAILIASILASVALPSFFESIKSSNMLNIANDMHRSIVEARSEAIKRGVSVTVCTSNVAKTDCLDSGNWEGGWIVREVPAGTDPVISIYEPLSASYSLHGKESDYKSNIVFNSSGETTSSGRIILCYGNAVDTQTRTVVVNRFGKVSVRDTARETPASCY
jgi:type IV fimbrial biogenesis protein FimT